MIRYLSWFCLLIVTLSSCSREVSLEEYRLYLYSLDNGLSQELKVEGQNLLITYWPAELVNSLGLSADPMSMLEVKSDSSAALYSKSEEDYVLKIGALEVRPSIVMAENNPGSGSRLLIGFRDGAVTDDFQLQFLSPQKIVMASLNFKEADLKKLPTLKTKS